jgi:outer membrane lipoprotein-sorting protein
MGKVPLLLVLLVILSMLSACAMMDSTIDQSDSYDGGSSSYSGHMHH